MNCNNFSSTCFHMTNHQNHQYIDLSYDLNKDTIMWPGGENFQLCMNCTARESATAVNTSNIIHDATREDTNKPTSISSINKNDSNYFYAAGVFTCSEHGGTHVDAPYHFNEFGNTVDLIQLCDLICDGRVIDISSNCNDNDGNEDNYILSLENILGHEEEYGILEPHSIVIIRTGWSIHYKEGSLKYIGYEECIHGPYNPTTSKLSFPGIGEEAAKLLVQRGVAAVGIDTASLDPGSEKTFIAHRILLGAGIYGIENLNENTNLLPIKGFTMLVMPLKITGGSGAPARVVAMIPSN